MKRVKGIANLGLSSIVVTLFTVLSRIFSIYRDRLLALNLGASVVVDDFFLLLGVSQFVTALFATSTINYYLPTLGDQNDPKKIKAIYLRLLKTWGGATLLLASTLSALYDYSVFVVCMTALSFLLLSLNHFEASLLNRKKKFVIPTVSFAIPILSTIVPILYQQASLIELLSWFLFGNIVQLFLLYSLNEKGVRRGVFNVFKKTDLSTPAIEPWSAFLTTWLPLLVVSMHFPVTEILNYLLAKNLADGSVSQMGYAMRIPLAVSNILTYSIWTVLLPQIQLGRKLPSIKKSGFIFSLFIGAGVVAAAILYILTPYIVHFVYGRGSSLSNEQLNQIIIIQSLFIIGFPFQLFASILLRFLQSLRKVGPTLFISVAGISSMLFYFYCVDGSLIGISKGFLANAFVTSLMLMAYWFYNSFRDQK